MLPDENVQPWSDRATVDGGGANVDGSVSACDGPSAQSAPTEVIWVCAASTLSVTVPVVPPPDNPVPAVTAS